eukprot:ctg_456.g141
MYATGRGGCGAGNGNALAAGERGRWGGVGGGAWAGGCGSDRDAASCTERARQPALAHLSVQRIHRAGRQ